MYATLSGYAMFYLCRKNISIALPAMGRDLGYSNTELGVLSTTLYVTYGVGKLANGALGDHANPRLFMATGLVLSAVTNLLFGWSPSLWALALLWGLNGWFQSMGFPPCARLLANWYSVSERGLMWSIWNISHQIGAGLVVVLTGYLIERHGWRSGFVVPGAVCILGALLLIDRLRDTPASLGLPSIARFRHDPELEADGTEVSEQPETVRQILVNRVLKNRHIWLISLMNMFVYIVRSGTFDWAAKFLVERKGSSIGAAGVITATFELAGIGGAVLAGAISDRLHKKRRGPMCLLLLLLSAGTVALLYSVPGGHPELDAACLALIGFCIYGPQFLVGVFVTDLASRKAAATAIGLTGVFGYAGAAVSGVGTGYFIDRFGWRGGFAFWIGAALLGTLVAVPLWRVGPAGPRPAARA
jgi:phosphoglycerate transporter family protein